MRKLVFSLPLAKFSVLFRSRTPVLYLVSLVPLVFTVFFASGLNQPKTLHYPSMQVVLLLAGRSKRFWPLEEKSLFPIAGTDLLAHQLSLLKKAGLTQITLVGGAHNLKLIKKQYPKLKIIEQEDLDHGMQGALLSVLLKMKEEAVLVLGGNDVIEASAIKSLKAAATKGKGAILAKKVERYFPGGYLTVQKGRILSIVEKPGAGHEPSDMVNIVAHIHPSPKKLLEALRSTDTGRDDGYERALTNLMLKTEYRAVSYSGLWFPVKYPWHLLDLLPHFLETYAKKHKGKKVSVHKTAVIEGDVYLSDGVRVLPHATIVGPAWIGPGAIIGTNALVRGSSIGARSIIGYNSEIKSAILAEDVWTHMSYIGDSVVGSNVAFGGGCTTGNFRLDEGEIVSIVSGDKVPTGRTKLGAVIGSGTRLGIQVGMNPGVKIGAGTFVSGGAYVTTDIPDQSYATMKNGNLDIRPNKISTGAAESREKYRKAL